MPRRPTVSLWSTSRTESAFEFCTDCACSLRQARQVVAYMRHYWRLWRQGKKSVEAGYAIGFGRRDIEPLTNIVERFRTDPAEAILHRVQRRQQEVPAGAQGGAAPGRGPGMGREAGPTHPTQNRRPRHRADPPPLRARLVGC